MQCFLKAVLVQSFLRSFARLRRAQDDDHGGSLPVTPVGSRSFAAADSLTPAKRLNLNRFSPPSIV